MKSAASVGTSSAPGPPSTGSTTTVALPIQTTRLASTVETWWPAILVALTEDVTNARTEGFNRIIKQTKRVVDGTVDVAVSYTIAGYFLPPLLTRFWRTFPGITVRLHEFPRDAIEQQAGATGRGHNASNAPRRRASSR